MASHAIAHVGARVMPSPSLLRSVIRFVSRLFIQPFAESVPSMCLIAGTPRIAESDVENKIREYLMLRGMKNVSELEISGIMVGAADMELPRMYQFSRDNNAYTLVEFTVTRRRH